MRWARAAAILAAQALSPASPAAASDRAALATELADVAQAAAPFRDISAARRAGWRRTTGHVPLMGEHWGRGPRTLPTGADAFDPASPQSLIYAKIGTRRELVAVAYVVRLRPGDPLPSGFNGADDAWHVHDVTAILNAVGETRPSVAWIGRRFANTRLAPDGYTRLAMLHVWLDGMNPDGPFADVSRALPYRRLGLGPAYWQDASLSAAEGTALAHPDGCAATLDGKLTLAGASRRTKAALGEVCRVAAASVADRLRAPPRAFNDRASRAWARVDAAAAALLTPAEQARIATLVEGDLPSGICRARPKPPGR